MNASELDFPLQWRHYCLPYKMLSNRLRRVHAEFGMRRVLSSRTLVGETKTFAGLKYYH